MWFESISMQMMHDYILTFLFSLYSRVCILYLQFLDNFQQFFLSKTNITFLSSCCPDGSVILESPPLPIWEGKNVALHCRNKTTYLKAYFYKNDVLMESTSAEKIIIDNVKLADEGLYKCNIPGVGKSPGSWLAVKGET